MILKRRRSDRVLILIIYIWGVSFRIYSDEKAFLSRRSLEFANVLTYILNYRLQISAWLKKEEFRVVLYQRRSAFLFTRKKLGDALYITFRVTTSRTNTRDIPNDDADEICRSVCVLAIANRDSFRIRSVLVRWIGMVFHAIAEKRSFYRLVRSKLIRWIVRINLIIVHAFNLSFFSFYLFLFFSFFISKRYHRQVVGWFDRVFAYEPYDVSISQSDVLFVSKKIPSRTSRLESK